MNAAETVAATPRRSRQPRQRAQAAPKSLAEAAARALAETDSYEAAAERLLALISPAQRAELLEDWERRAALALVRKAASEARGAAWAATPRQQAASVSGAAAVAALAGGVSASLLDFRLPGGGRLGDAVREDVAAAARFFHSQADDMRWKAQFLDRVAGATPAGRRVAEALDETALRALQDAARGQ